MRLNRFLAGTAMGAALFGARHLARRSRRIDFEGRVVCITGGSRGLGFALAEALASEGARLALIARDEDELEEARRRLLSAGNGDVLTIAADIGRPHRARAIVDTVRDAYGGIDVVVNNAGTIQVAPVEHLQRSDFDDAMQVHFWGPLEMILAALPAMRSQGFGRIVNITSVGGRVAVPHLAAYCASKFALVGLSDVLRAELRQYGIRVTTVSPGLMRTGSHIHAQVKGQHEPEYGWFAALDEMPILSMNARRAAAKIVEACRHGDANLILGLPARLAILAEAVAPSLFGEAMAIVNRALPSPSELPEAEEPRVGWEVGGPSPHEVEYNQYPRRPM
jgi:NAD(P)-dependent dehydrogenase (short-subunit alcohol dehydrogenase family)